MRVTKTITNIILIGVAGLSLVFGSGFLMGTHTKYCPWSHLLLHSESCAIRDQRGGLVMIEHHDGDNITNDNNYLEIREGFHSYKFKIPGSAITLGGSVELIPGERDAILLNSHRQELIPF